MRALPRLIWPISPVRNRDSCVSTCRCCGQWQRQQHSSDCLLEHNPVPIRRTDRQHRPRRSRMPGWRGTNRVTCLTAFASACGSRCGGRYLIKLEVRSASLIQVKRSRRRPFTCLPDRRLPSVPRSCGADRPCHRCGWRVPRSGRRDPSGFLLLHDEARNGRLRSG